MAKQSTKKVTVTYPLTGTERNMDTAIYEPIKAAILKCLKGSKGKTFTELSKEVTEIIKKQMPAFKKSIPWYTISVKRDLESRGIVQAFEEKGKKLNRLKK
ncbi:MAG: hypothetical protein JST09_19315 [Bacteroidetes bacterium]|nr:hypothetical protein [Bacteroidota bacterium]